MQSSLGPKQRAVAVVMKTIECSVFGHHASILHMSWAALKVAVSWRMVRSLLNEQVTSVCQDCSMICLVVECACMRNCKALCALGFLNEPRMHLQRLYTLSVLGQEQI